MRAAVFAFAVAAAALIAAAPLACSDDEVTSADAGAEAATADASEGGADGASDAGVVARGARVLGVAVAVEDLEFPPGVLAAREAGARSTNATFGWDEIERPIDGGAADAGGDTDPDADAGDDAGAASTQLFNPLLHVVDLVLSDSRTQLTLTVDALDVGGSRAPGVLAARPLDDPELGARYDRLTDYVLAQLPDTPLNALLVASSVDVALGADAAKHAAFARFVARAAAHAHAIRPALQVGFSVTHEAVVDAQGAGRLAAAWAASDVIAITYLPGIAAAQARPVTEVGPDVDRLVAALPVGKPLLLHEVGYPTAAAAGGSEVSKAAFVTAAFAAWDRHATRIPILTFRELDDADGETAARLGKRAGRADAPFFAYLQSLGMRSGGRAKPSLEAFIRDARARGF